MLSTVALVVLAGGVAVVARAARGLRESVRLIRRPTTPLRDLTAGPVEVAGVIRAPVPLHTTCGVLGVARVWVSESTAKNARGELERMIDLADDTTIESDGISCPIRLAGCHILAEPWERRGHQVLHTELVLPDGAHVVVSGVAVAEPDPDDGDYRAPGTRYVLAGDAEHPLVVSMGGEVAGLWRHESRGVAALAAGILMILVGLAALGLDRHLRALGA